MEGRRSLVEAVLEVETKEGKLRDTELFLFTDNSTAEALCFTEELLPTAICSTWF
jgi:hypothetical protein